MDTALTGAFYQTVSKIAYLPKADGKNWVEIQNGEEIRTLVEVKPLESEMVTETFLLDKENCEILKLDRMNVRVAKVSSDWDAEKDNLPSRWDIIHRGQWDSKINEQ